MTALSQATLALVTFSVTAFNHNEHNDTQPNHTFFIQTTLTLMTFSITTPRTKYNKIIHNTIL